jgi:hypothetical protein
LFRYDTGIALLGVHACAIAIAIYLRVEGISNRVRTFADSFWPYLVGFAILTLPPALYYLSVAPLRPVVYDIILYPRHHYYGSRNLPFPVISLRELDYLGKLEVNAPPYIVLDSEYDLVREPNDSSKSSGVTLLDDYIHSKYQPIRTFGDLSVWQGIHNP